MKSENNKKKEKDIAAENGAKNSKKSTRMARKCGIIASFIIGIPLALVLLVWGGLNCAKFAIYSDYYSAESTVCKNPGLGDGFICQGIAVCESEGKFLISGYMNDKTASRIYVTDTSNDSYYITLSKGGEDFRGHVGGIAASGDRVFLANDERLYELSLTSLLATPRGGSIDVGEGVPVNNAASYVFTDDTFIYVGEFTGAGSYSTDNTYDTPNGQQNAIITKYSLNDLTAPVAVYSVRDKVQGACFTPNGKVVLSTSYAISSSVYYIYDLDEAIDSGKTLDGAPVYLLTNCEREIKGPAMSEDLDWYDGGVITLTESASDKYIFGKLFFATNINKLDIG